MPQLKNMKHSPQVVEPPGLLQLGLGTELPPGRQRSQKRELVSLHHRHRILRGWCVACWVWGVMLRVPRTDSPHNQPEELPATPLRHPQRLVGGAVRHPHQLTSPKALARHPAQQSPAVLQAPMGVHHGALVVDNVAVPHRRAGVHCRAHKDPALHPGLPHRAPAPWQRHRVDVTRGAPWIQREERRLHVQPGPALSLPQRYLPLIYGEVPYTSVLHEFRALLDHFDVAMAPGRQRRPGLAQPEGHHVHIQHRPHLPFVAVRGNLCGRGEAQPCGEHGHGDPRVHPIGLRGLPVTAKPPGGIAQVWDVIHGKKLLWG
eukprot:RCo020865